MHFKVKKKDFIIFIVYCVFFLYICALIVVNTLSLLNTGEFEGLNPLKAFLFPNNLFTAILFLSIVFWTLSSTKSSIFDKDSNGKGFFSLVFGDKPSNGFSNWSSDKDMKNGIDVVKINPSSEETNAAGIPLLNNGKDVYVDNGEYHNMIIGSTGSGKSTTIVIPLVTLLARHGESMIITDPKGELYKSSSDYLREKGFNIVLLNFREPSTGNSWNPLALPYEYYKNGKEDKAIELLTDISKNIMYEKTDDVFWQNSAADYFAGIALGLFEDGEVDEVNLNSISYAASIGEKRVGMSTLIKEYFKIKGEDSQAYSYASGTIDAPNETKGSILSTFKQKIRLFTSGKALSEMLSHSNFDMRDIGRNKTAVFLIIHDEKKTYHGLMTIFIKQCYETLIDVAQECGGKLPQRTNFILDEFANMPRINDIDSMISAARSRLIRFTFIIQNFSQLDGVYGSEVALTIRGNCGNTVYLISTETKALEEISKLCGDIKVKVGKGEKEVEETRPLVSVTDLQKMKPFEAIILRLRMAPFRTQMTPCFKMDWGLKQGNAEFFTRENTEPKLFNIEKYVNEHKQQPAGGMPGMGGSMFGGGMGMSGMPGMGGSMFGGGMGGSMFGPSPAPSSSKPLFDDPIPEDKPPKTKTTDSSNTSFPKISGLENIDFNNLESVSDEDLDKALKELNEQLKKLSEESDDEDVKAFENDDDIVVKKDDEPDFFKNLKLDEDDEDDDDVIIENDIKVDKKDDSDAVDAKIISDSDEEKKDDSYIPPFEDKKFSFKFDVADDEDDDEPVDEDYPKVFNSNGNKINNTVNISDLLNKEQKDDKSSFGYLDNDQIEDEPHGYLDDDYQAPSDNTGVNKLEKTEIEKTPSSDDSNFKYKVDNDSVIVNENIVTDDEYYDDFFGDE